MQRLNGGRTIGGALAIAVPVEEDKSNKQTNFRPHELNAGMAQVVEMEEDPDSVAEEELLTDALANIAVYLDDERETLGESGCVALDALVTVVEGLMAKRKVRAEGDPLRDRRPKKFAKQADTRPIVGASTQSELPHASTISRRQNAVVPDEVMLAYCKEVTIPLELAVRYGGYVGVAFRHALRIVEVAELEKRKQPVRSVNSLLGRPVEGTDAQTQVANASVALAERRIRRIENKIDQIYYDQDDSMSCMHDVPVRPWQIGGMLIQGALSQSWRRRLHLVWGCL